MSKDLDIADTDEEARFLMFFEEAMILAEESSPDAVERNVQLRELAAFAGREFVGREVRVSPSLRKDRPITAWYYATPNPVAGSPGYRPQETGLLTRRNPSKAIGTIEKLDLRQSTLKVTPRLWSPYRFDRGFFLIDVLTESRQSRVEVKFVDRV